MSPTIALICLWLMTHPQPKLIGFDPTVNWGALAYPVVYPEADTTHDIGWTLNVPSPVYYINYTPAGGTVCPIHGPLSHGSWGEALTFAGPDACHTRPVCLRCLMAAINAPDSCIPQVEVRP